MSREAQLTVPEPPRVRVVVVDFRGGDMTLDCLRHLFATAWSRERLEVVLVDNGSGDATAARAEQAHPGLRVVRSPVNCGFGAGSTWRSAMCSPVGGPTWWRW